MGARIGGLTLYLIYRELGRAMEYDRKAGFDSDISHYVAAIKSLYNVASLLPPRYKQQYIACMQKEGFQNPTFLGIYEALMQVCSDIYATYEPYVSLSDKESVCFNRFMLAYHVMYVCVLDQLYKSGVLLASDFGVIREVEGEHES